VYSLAPTDFTALVCLKSPFARKPPGSFYSKPYKNGGMMEKKNFSRFWILRLSTVVIFSLLYNISFAEIVFIDDFRDSVPEARFVIEAENYSNCTSTAKGSWWEVDGKNNKFIEGPKTNEIASSFIGNVRENYMMVLGTVIGDIEPTDSSYDGPFLDYKISIKKPGDYNLYLRWIGRDGSTDSVYASILKPDNSLLVGSGPDYFLFHGRTWGAYGDWVWDNQGLQNKIACAYAGRPDFASWHISEPGIYTIRLALRETETAIDALVFRTPEPPSGPPQSQFKVRMRKELRGLLIIIAFIFLAVFLVFLIFFTRHKVKEQFSRHAI
jgi:hypothetical protein